MEPERRNEQIKINLPDIFAYVRDETRAQIQRVRSVNGHARNGKSSGRVQGRNLRVESDEEARRLVAQLLQNDGYEVETVTCLAEARDPLRSDNVDLLLARPECVPTN